MGAQDRVQAEVCLVGQTGKCQYRLCAVPASRAQCRGEMLTQQHIIRLAQQVENQDDHGRNQDDADDHRAPPPAWRQDGPAQQQQQRHCRGNQTAPQVIEDFPLGQGREWILPAAACATVLEIAGGISAVGGYAAQQPGCNLPIAADPAVPAAHVRAVGGWILLVQLHIAQQAGPRMTAFEQVVAEYPVFGEAATERALERIDLIDAFADERTLAAQVLVNIGDSARIGVDAGFAAEQSRIA